MNEWRVDRVGAPPIEICGLHVYPQEQREGADHDQHRRHQDAPHYSEV